MTPTALGAKGWTTLVARAALLGFQLWRSDPDDGVQRFFIGRCDAVRVLRDAAEVDRFLQQLAEGAA